MASPGVYGRFVASRPGAQCVWCGGRNLGHVLRFSTFKTKGLNDKIKTVQMFLAIFANLQKTQ